MAGGEDTLKSLLKHLLVLEHDAIAAYDETIARLSSPAFKTDHLRHVAELEAAMRAGGFAVPEGGDMMGILTVGTVRIAGLMEDEAVLKAMKSNEDQTVAAYEKAARHPVAPAALRPALERAHQDELRHRAWMEASAAQL